MTELGILLILLYFVPSLVAKLRKKRNRDAIMLLNLLLGWTVIGWIVALIWAVTVDTPQPVQTPRA
jgi:cytoskeletal protein RodZ